MIYRKPRLDEGDVYEEMALHPLQSQAWGDFREKNGLKVERLVGFDESTPVSQMQITFHPIPKLPYTIGYFPKGRVPDEVGMAALTELGKREKAIFIKLEPDSSTPPKLVDEVENERKFLTIQGCVEGKPLFTKYSFVVDLTASEEDLMSRMKPKTRYNIRLAQKRGVQVVEDSSENGFAEYLELLKLTTKRQQFYAHTQKYQTAMWEKMSKAGIGRILKATYQNQTLVAWIVFAYKDRLFYPYGASSREHREVMASNLLMWEAMLYGKKQGFKKFDLWGALSPKPDPKDPWYGFHTFKEGYGGELAEFVGSYDLVINPMLYKLYHVAEKWRWRLLRLKSKLSFIS